MTASDYNEMPPAAGERNSEPRLILSTKQLSPALLQYARENGLEIDCIPFISTVPVTDPTIVRQVQELPLQNIYVAFTSGIAAQAVAAMLTAPPKWKIFSLHNQTRKNVEACFPGSEIVATAQYGEDLAKEILRRKEVKEIVFFCGNKRMDSLPSLLPAHGVRLQEFVVYETILTPSKPDKKYNAILFYSPSGVESFCSVNKVDENTPLLSIGNTTTNAIRKKLNNKVYTAATATVEGVIELAIQTNKLK